MSEIAKNVMEEMVNPAYPEGLKEIADMLTFLPEEMRVVMAATFVKNICKM